MITFYLKKTPLTSRNKCDKLLRFMIWVSLREKHAIVIPPVPEIVAHLVLKPIEEAEQL